MPKTSHPQIGLLQKDDGVAWYCYNDLSNTESAGYFESRDLAEVERHVAEGGTA